MNQWTNNVLGRFEADKHLRDHNYIESVKMLTFWNWSIAQARRNEKITLTKLLGSALASTLMKAISTFDFEKWFQGSHGKDR